MGRGSIPFKKKQYTIWILATGLKKILIGISLSIFRSLYQSSQLRQGGGISKKVPACSNKSADRVQTLEGLVINLKNTIKYQEEERKKLLKRIDDLERLNKLFVNREFRIKELRGEVKNLSQKLGSQETATE